MLEMDKHATNTSCQLVSPVRLVEIIDLHIQVAMSKRNVSTVVRHCNFGDQYHDSVNSRRICNSPGAIVGTLLQHERSLSHEARVSYLAHF